LDNATVRGWNARTTTRGCPYYIFNDLMIKMLPFKNAPPILLKGISAICLLFLTSCGGAPPSDPPSPQTPDISGIIVDSAALSPLSGVSVFLYPAMGFEPLVTVETGPNGSFQFKSLSEGDYAVFAVKNESEKRLISPLSVRPPQTVHALGTISLSKTGSLSGTAQLKSATNNSGIRIRVFGTGLKTSTSSNGSFALTGIPSGSVSVVVEKPGYTSVITLNVSIIGQQTLFLSSLELNQELKTGSLSGKTILEGQTDHSGALVRVLDYEAQKLTSSAGNYEFQIPLGYYEGLSFFKEDFAPTETSRVLTITSTPLKMEDLTLKAVANTLKGTVKIHATSNYEGISVTLLGSTFNIQTQANGSYELKHVPLKEYTLQLSYPNSKTITQSVVIKPGPPITASEGFLIPLGSLTGKILLQGLSDSKGSTLSVTVLKGTSYEEKRVQGVDSTGNISLSDVPVGSYSLTLSRTGYDIQTVSVEVKAGQTASFGTVTLQDTTPPVSLDNSDGKWTNKTTVTVTLTATDSGSGVASTFYQINNGATQNVTSDGHPLFSAEGVHTLTYWSTDKAGNIETSKQSPIIRIDRTVTINAITENSGGLKKKIGDSIHFTMDTGETDGQAKVFIGPDFDLTLFDDNKHGDTVPNNGVYERALTITKGMEAKTSFITGTFVDKATNKATKLLNSPVSIDGNPPSPPKNIKPLPHTKQVFLDWDDNKEFDILGYNVYRSSIGNNGPFFKLNTNLVSSSQYLDTGLTNAVFYYYKLTAVDDSLNEGDFTEAYEAMPAYWIRDHVKVDTVWDPTDNPFILITKANVETGAKLTINPGVNVYATQNTHLKILGSIKAIGTAQSPITFQSFKVFQNITPSKGDWEGVLIETGKTVAEETALSQQGPVLSYWKLQHAENGLTISNSSALITYCTIQHNALSGIRLSQANQTRIYNSLIQYNNANGISIISNGTSVSNNVSNNTIKNNVGYGIWAGGETGGIQKLTIQNNTISDNTSDGIQLGTPQSVTLSDCQILSNTISKNMGNGLSVSHQNHHILKNTVNTNGKIGIHLQKVTSVNVGHNTIKSNLEWAISLGEASQSNTIEHNLIEQNGFGIRVGEPGETQSLSTIQNKIRYNHIQHNLNTFLQINVNPHVGDLDKNKDIERNNFINNQGSKKVENTTSSSVILRENYWASQVLGVIVTDIDPSKINGYIYDKDENSKLGPVYFEPILVKSEEEAGPR